MVLWQHMKMSAVHPRATLIRSPALGLKDSPREARSPEHGFSDPCRDDGCQHKRVRDALIITCTAEEQM